MHQTTWAIWFAWNIVMISPPPLIDSRLGCPPPHRLKTTMHLGFATGNNVCLLNMEQETEMWSQVVTGHVEMQSNANRAAHLWWDHSGHVCWLSAPSCRALADTRQIGKLTREQFAVAMYLIQQKVSKGLDPPQALTADMIPPSERSTPVPVGHTHKQRMFTRNSVGSSYTVINYSYTHVKQKEKCVLLPVCHPIHTSNQQFLETSIRTLDQGFLFVSICNKVISFWQ